MQATRLKHIGVALASLTVAAAAQAAAFTAPTSAVLTLSSDITGALGSSATISALGSATYNSASNVLSESFTSVSMSSGAATDLIGLTNAASGFAISTTSGGVTKTLNVTGISYSNATKSLSAVLTMDSVQKYSGVFLTSATTPSVSETFNAALGTGLLTTGSLNLTSSSATAVLSAFGLSTSALYVGFLQGVNFGTLKVDVTAAASVTPSVPEPGTYALMGLGLVGIAAVARRRQQG
ncbi:PEP-CTERM sorting domain-containing protein [Aquabacterium sp.]|uniref:PEP-CTERM sorting domain-containing protein n=1 Tax=Aquabacterium sp. TaxID=1872578 RepID=UPI0025BF4A65|nr:PEP-CTERM sorting domain-containing protein [Aquabacterium sp.]